MKLIDKDKVVAEIKRIEHETNYEPFTDEVLGKRCACRSLLSFIDTLEVKEIPNWKKTMHGDCWSGEIGVHPSKRLYEYEHYTINADELFKLLDKEE